MSAVLAAARGDAAAPAGPMSPTRGRGASGPSGQTFWKDPSGYHSASDGAGEDGPMNAATDLLVDNMGEAEKLAYARELVLRHRK